VTPPVVLYLVAVLAAVLLVCVAIRNRRVPSARWFGVFAGGIALWGVATLLQLSRPTLIWQATWRPMAVAGVVIVVFGWATFGLSYGGHGGLLTRRTLLALAIEPVLVMALVVTNGAHGLIWTGSSLGGTAAQPVVVGTPGPLFWVHAAYSYLLVGVGVAAIAWEFLRSDHAFRGQSGLLLVGVAIPWLSNAVYLFAPDVTGQVDPTPVAFAASGWLFAFGVRSYRLLDLVPATRRFARDVAIADMTEGALVLDVRDRVIEVNDAGRRVIDRPRESILGRHLEAVLPSAAAVLDPADEGGVEFSSTVGDESRTYRATASPVRSPRGRRIGRLVVLHDVTDRRRREQRLAVQNRMLRHNLRNDLNVVLGRLDEVAERIDDPATLDTVEEIRDRAAGLVEQSRTARHIERVLNGETATCELTVAPVVEQVAATVRERHPDVSVGVTVPERLRVRVDESLGRALHELAENAVEHGECSTLEFRARASGERAVLEVVDDGSGVSQYERTALARADETPLEHGSGLGLWFVTWVASRTGGEFDVTTREAEDAAVREAANAETREAEDAAGTVARVRLPLVEA